MSVPSRIDFSTADYNTKFQFRNQNRFNLNLNGYGVSNPFKPPL